MRAYIVGILSLFVLGFAMGQEIEITKDALKKNPTLKIRSWKGSPEFLEQFQRDLTYADWFDLTPGNDADYYIDGEAGRVEGQGWKVTLKFTTRSGKASSLSLGMVNMTWLSHALSDHLIKHVFNTPGPCAAYLAFVREQGKTKNIWLSEFDGSNAQPVTKKATIATEPNWSYDNRFVSYTLYGKINTQVIVFDVNKGRFKSLAKFPGLNSGCSLGSRNHVAAMSLSKDGQVDLYVCNTMGGGMKRLTNSSFVEASPCWSPDDKTICFVGSQSRRPTLFLIPSSGGTPKRLLNQLVEAVSPDWSSVSNKICFSIRRGGAYAIAVVDMNGASREYRIPFALAGDWEAPSWMADGRHVVCSRTHSGQTRLFIADTWYGRVRELRTGSGASLPDCSSSFLKR